MYKLTQLSVNISPRGVKSTFLLVLLRLELNQGSIINLIPSPVAVAVSNNHIRK
ncbi:MAG: hypothetical protein ACI9N3_002778 [Colwellia sp.]|jgi:hypothetical protein